MTRTDGLRSPYGIATAALLTVASALVAFLCFRTAVIEALPAASPSMATVAPNAPGPLLERAATALVAQHGILDVTTLAAVRNAATVAPLDARAFLILGHQQLLDREPARAVQTLEAAQRLDPRNPVTHLLLLDRYLRDHRDNDAAAQFSISARLVGSAEGPIATAMAQMSLAPDTHDAVRRTLATDPVLEGQVLIALAQSDTAPAALFALASPSAIRNAGGADSWGPILVNRLVGHGRFAEARSIWQRVYRLSSPLVAAPIYDAGFHELPGSAPFNWTLSTGSIGGADIRNGTLAIDYYGRETGTLATQLLVLAPGSYHLTFAVESGKVANGPSVAWMLGCLSDTNPPAPGPALMSMVIAATGVPHRQSATVTVPANCPAQTLALIGNASEFPTPVELTIHDLALQPILGSRS